MAVQAILFDFDNTIAYTESIRGIRESRAYDELTPETMARVRVYDPVPNLLSAIRAAGVKIGIVTNAGRGYLTPVLQHLNLTDAFDAIVTYTDVRAEGKKPSPKGIELVLEHLGIKAGPGILYIGDENTDHEAAYRAGVTPVMPTWATRNSVTMAPAIEMSSNQLIQYLTDPGEFQLFAERCAELGTANYPRRGVYFLALDDSSNVVTLKEEMTSLCFGRYFSQKAAITALMHERHALSLEIQRKETETPYQVPEHWCDLMAHVVRHPPSYIFDDANQHFDIVTVIPAKNGKDPRLERLLGGVEKRLQDAGHRAACVPDLLYFLDDAQSQKTLSRTERSYEARRALQFNSEHSGLVAGSRVLVIDDVTTTGATMERARNLLLGAGAAAAYGAAIAKTVSLMEDERPCPACGRPLKVKRNSKTGEHFWGCTGFADEENQCRHHEPLEKRECPKCGRDMRVQKVKRTGVKFWSCTGWNQNPTCNYSMDYDESEMPT
ncbi:HAD-IA family hydrolase [Burkholderia territorii]|uniref:HAD-IA family hydrolase n=1 Tax=Burkholderia territorii TaxID=1503055 RepID=UPI0009BE72FE|nr:HAD-IA family hydrolase [Burkholderia territorii]